MIKLKCAALILAAGIVFISCHPQPAKSVSNMKNSFDKEGHRGCAGLMPENTIPAMLYAIDLGVTTLEMDTHITKDSQVVISHDPWFNPNITIKPDGSYIDTTKPKYVLYQMTYDSIKQFDVGLKPYNRFPQQKKIAVYKPLLNDLIDSTEAYSKQKGRRIEYNIEIKSAASGDNIYHPMPDVFTAMVMRIINEKNIASRVIIQSFDNRPLQYMHKQYPSMRTSLLIEGFDKRSLQQQFDALGFVPSVYSPHHQLVTKKLVEACHRLHCKVIPWTVDDLEEMKRLKALGVDGLISDYPDLYKEL